MGAAHSAAGLPAVAFLYAAAIACCTWLWMRLNWAAGGDFLLASLMLPPLLSTANLHWLARPHVFSWIFLLAALCYAERAAGRFGLRHALGIAAFGAAWANVHASFFLAPVVALIYAAGMWIGTRVWQEPNGRPGGRPAWFLKAAACAAAGSLANPYGWELHRHVFAYLANDELLRRIGEFHSFDFHVEGAWQIVLMLGLAGTGTILALARRRLDHFLLGVLLLAMGLRSARGLPIVALAVLPLANGAIAETLRRCGGLRERLAGWRDGYFAYTDQLRRIDSRCSGLAWVPVILVLTFALVNSPAVAARTGFPADQFPVGAAAAVGRLPAGARLLAPDMYGGYLIYRFDGARKVFMDGRSDFYGVDFMQRYIKLIEVRPGWRTIMDEFGFTHALLPRNYSLAGVLEGEGWRRRYADETAVLLEK